MKVLCVLVMFVTAVRTTDPCTIENIEISVDIRAENVIVSWTYDTTCPAVMYMIEHSIDGTQVQRPTVVHNPEFALTKIICSRNIVTVIVRTQLGTMQEAVKSFVVGQYNPVEKLRYADGRFEWSPPIGTESCSVTYDLVWENALGVRGDNIQDTHFAFDLLPCVNRITVTPVVLETPGPSEHSDQTVIPENVGPVQDLIFHDGRFEWNPPIDTASCTVKYDVVLENGMGTVTERIEENNFQFVVRPCLNSVAVTPVVLGVIGLAARSEHTSIPEIVGPVRDLEFNSERERFEWRQPIDTSSCTVTYEVRFENESGPENSMTLEENFMFELRPCTWNHIEVTPVVLGTRGILRSCEHTVRPHMNAPVHVSTDPSISGAVVVWRLNRPEGNVCEIRGFVVKLSPDIEFVGHVDGESGTATANIVKLTEGKPYSYTTRWILDDNEESDRSAEVIFLTVPLTSPSIAVDQITATGFVTSWEQPYDVNFIHGHRVIITRNGPLHFLPEGCDQDDYVTSYDINDNSVNEHTFLLGEPSFKYTVELFTMFTLGLERSAVETIGTLETDPGDLIMTPQLDFERNVRYAASANIVWPVPCDVNGIIRSFSYRITGDMNIENIESCQMAELNGDVTEMNDDYTYSIRINDLLPFLKYRVYVTTNLLHHSHTTETTFDPPPIYTPPLEQIK